MRVSYVSDLHLEFRDYPDFSKEEGGDVLLLVGDIFTAPMFGIHRTDGDARKFQKYLKVFKANLLDKYQKIFYVMGNHEHYHSTFTKTADSLRDGFRRFELPIFLMDNDQVDLGDTTLIGCTLWSDYMGNNPLSKSDCEYGMNDYRLIKSGEKNTISYMDKNATPDLFLAEFDRSVEYIKTVLNNQKNRKTIVMTHHAPTYTSLNKEHIGNGMDGAYASNLSDLILDYPQIKYWVHGHTHMNCNYSVGDYTKVLANGRGYPGERCYKLYSGLKHFEV